MKSSTALFVFLLTIASLSCTDDLPDLAEVESLDPDIGTVYSLDRELSSLSEMFRSTNTVTGEEIEYQLECFTINSSFYDPVTQGFGFVNCDNTFRLINPINGEQIRSFELDHNLAQVVLDFEAYEVIGIYGFAQNDLRIVRYNLTNGNLVSDHAIELDTYFSCMTFYSQTKKEYHIIMPYGVVTLDPTTGETIRTLQINFGWEQVSYNEINNTFSRIHHAENGEVFLENFDAETGLSLKQTRVMLGTPRTCFFNFDHLNQDFALSMGDDKVIFVNTETGEISSEYESKDDVSPFLIWRAQ